MAEGRIKPYLLIEVDSTLRGISEEDKSSVETVIYYYFVDADEFWKRECNGIGYPKKLVGIHVAPKSGDGISLNDKYDDLIYRHPLLNEWIPCSRFKRLKTEHPEHVLSISGNKTKWKGLKEYDKLVESFCSASLIRTLPWIGYPYKHSRLS